MWFLPAIVIGAIIYAAGKSSRKETPLSRQLLPPALSGASMAPAPTAPLPGPIAVLGEILRIGKYPPPKVILCAIAEAEALNRRDLVEDIFNTFVLPVMQQYQQMCNRNPYRTAWMPQVPAYAPMPQAPAYAPAPQACVPMPQAPAPQAYAPMPQVPAYMPAYAPAPPAYTYLSGAASAPVPCTSPRARADAWMPQAAYGRGSAPAPARAPAYGRGCYAPARPARAPADAWMPQGMLSPRARVDSWVPRAPREDEYVPVPRAPQAAPSVAAVPSPSPVAVPQVAARQPTEDEILDMLHSDPKGFLSMVGAEPQRRGPLVEVFPIGSSPMTSAEPTPPPSLPQPAVPAPTHNADALSEQLLQMPGHAGSGIVLLPSTGAEVFDVRWLRGYPIPPLPQTIDGRPVCVVIVDALPVAQPTGLPPEVVAQMQEEAGLPEAADQTLALAPGSPIAGVSDEAWRQFVMRLEREAPTFTSSRHVGQYRQRRERLADLGIDPRSILGSATAQRLALDKDLADAHVHATNGGLVDEHVGRPIAVPGREGSEPLTLSGLLGVIQCAGLDGAVGWLESPNDRKRYPHTTQAFMNTNGVF